MSCSGQCKVPKTPIISKPASSLVEDQDDVWGSDEDVPVHADLQRAHVTQGYLDGLVQAQEAGLQKGFDDGFPQGAALGIRVGQILASLHGTPHFDTAKKDLNIVKVLDVKYFDENLNQTAHELVDRWEGFLNSVS